MARRAWRALALLVAQGLVSAGCAPPAETPRPSFLVVVVDDWSLSDFDLVRADDDPWNDLPSLDALAERGREWRRFYSQPVCASTRISLMFGRYYGETVAGSCARAGPYTPPAGTPSLASVLRDGGWATGAFGKWHVAAHPDPERPWEEAPGAFGFDVWRALSGSNIGGHCHSNGYEDWYRVDDGEGRTTHEYHTDAVADAARAWWSATPGPKLAYVAFQAPHQPMHVPPASSLPSGFPTPVTQRAKFEAMLVALDTALARLLEVVDRDETYVLVLGDNGTPATAAREGQDRRRMKATTFEEGINVPLLVAGPGVGAGTTGSLGHAVDLLATLADLAGVAVPPGLDSVSLAGTLRDAGAEPRAELVCDYVAPERGEASKTRQSLEELGIDLPRHRDTAVLWRDPTTRALLKGRWVIDLESGASKREVEVLEPSASSHGAVSEAALAHLDAAYGAYLERVPVTGRWLDR